MTPFREQFLDDIYNVFLNLDEFADLRTIRYDGIAYQDIPVVLEGPVSEERKRLADDHIYGLHLVTAVLHCAQKDLGGKLPKQGTLLEINNQEGGGGFFRKFYVAAAASEMGMLRIELEAVKNCR